jgi:hypothetical protein
VKLRRAVGRVNHTPGKMNKLEAAYALQLKALQQINAIHAFSFEAIKLRLANLTFFTPDFLVIGANGEVVFHEVKGHWEDDARVKIKVSAEAFPWFRFVGVTRKKGQWIVEEF